MPPPKQPFVIDMRHDETADTHYGVRQTWEEALQVARKYWEGCDGEYDETAKQPFKAGEGYDQQIFVNMRKGSYLFLSDSGGSGPCIRIERATK